MTAKAAEMIASGYARIVPALNAKAPDILKTETSSASPEAPLETPHATYHSTGIQTQPLCNGDQFKEVFGRDPTRDDLQRRIGIAAIGRYEDGLAKPHEIFYGAPIRVARVAERTAAYVDSAFQTKDATDCKKAIARAKVKASITAYRYRRVAQEAGYRVWAESNDEGVIHSEQFLVDIGLDAEGNAKGANLDGLFLPNIYGEELESRHNNSRITSQILQETNNGRFSDLQPLRPIPVFAPSTRKSGPNPEPIEDYGYEFSLQEEEIESDLNEDLKGRPVEHIKGSEGVDPAAFVIHETLRTTPAALPVSSKDDTRFSFSQNSGGDIANRAHQSSPKGMKIFGLPKSSDSSPVKGNAQKEKIDYRSGIFSSPARRPRDSDSITNKQDSSRAGPDAAHTRSVSTTGFRTENIPRGPRADRNLRPAPQSNESRGAAPSRRRSSSGDREFSRFHMSWTAARKKEGISRKDEPRQGPLPPSGWESDNETTPTRSVLQEQRKENIWDLRESRGPVFVPPQLPKHTPTGPRRLEPSAKRQPSPDTDIEMEDQYDDFARAREVEDRRREITFAITPGPDRSYQIRAKENGQDRARKWDGELREEPEDEMARARRAEDRRRELHHASISNPDITRSIRKSSTDETGRSMVAKEESSGGRDAQQARPRRMVREEIKRYDPRERLKERREMGSSDGGNAMQDRYGGSKAVDDGSLERDDDRRKRRKW